MVGVVQIEDEFLASSIFFYRGLFFLLVFICPKYLFYLFRFKVMELKEGMMNTKIRNVKEDNRQV